MSDFFARFFDASFMPHGHCYQWEPEILWLHAVSDGTIALAYYTIPFLLVYIVRKRKDLAFPWMFVMFGAFIILCGTTHVLEIYSIWNGAYRMTGAVKAVTGAVSIATAFALIPLVPRVLTLVGPGQLQAANEALRNEIVARERAEQELRTLNERLEARVAERTEALELVNADLRHEIDERERAERRLLEANRTLEDRVTDRTQQIRDLASQLTRAEQGERHALAQVLHDELQQVLFSVQLKLQSMQATLEDPATISTQAHGHLEAADSFLTQAIDTTRRLTVDLSPIVLKGGGLGEALEWLVFYMKERFDLRIDLSTAEGLTVPQEDMRVLLFQTVREALFNIAKYAGTDHARVVLSEHADVLTILVEDDGKGFDADHALDQPADVLGGFGLRNARERLGLFGAELSVHSLPGEGTRVRIRVPLTSIRST